MSFQRIARRVNPNVSFLYFDIQSYGLCNQLFSMACGIADGSQMKKPVAFRGLYPDMTSSRFLPIETFIDVEATNRQISDLGTKILTMVKGGPRMVRANMFASNDWQRNLQQKCLQLFVFSNAIQKKANELAPQAPFYCIHFRLDVDMLLFYRAGPDVYHKWIGLTDLKRENDARNIVIDQIEKNRDWIRERIKAYVDAVNEHCVDASAPIYVLTGIGKTNIHLGQNDLMEWAFNEFQQALAMKSLVRGTKMENLIGREYAAAVELNVACHPNVLGFIGSSGSTFSETIRLRNKPEKFLAVVN